MDAIAIKEAAEAIKTLAAQAAAVTALAPFHDEINALTDQIAFQADCILRWYLSDQVGEPPRVFKPTGRP